MAGKQAQQHALQGFVNDMAEHHEGQQRLDASSSKPRSNVIFFTFLAISRNTEPSATGPDLTVEPTEESYKGKAMYRMEGVMVPARNNIQDKTTQMPTTRHNQQSGRQNVAHHGNDLEVSRDGSDLRRKKLVAKASLAELQLHALKAVTQTGAEIHCLPDQLL